VLEKLLDDVDEMLIVAVEEPEAEAVNDAVFEGVAERLTEEVDE